MSISPMRRAIRRRSCRRLSRPRAKPRFYNRPYDSLPPCGVGVGGAKFGAPTPPLGGWGGGGHRAVLTPVRTPPPQGGRESEQRQFAFLASGYAVSMPA